MTTDDDNKASADQTNAQHSQGFIGQAPAPHRPWAASTL